MKKIILTLCVALSLTACQSDSVREASDTRLVIESLACGESIEIFGVKPNSFRPTYLINQLEDLRERHEATLAIAGYRWQDVYHDGIGQRGSSAWQVLADAYDATSGLFPVCLCQGDAGKPHRGCPQISHHRKGVGVTYIKLIAILSSGLFFVIGSC